MRKRNREITIFSLSAIDLFCSGMGAIMVLMVLLMPFYKMTVRVSDLDIVIVLDTTGSMEASIDGLKNDTEAIVVALQRLSKHLNIGVVAYRNTAAQGPSEITETGIDQDNVPMNYVTHKIGPYSFDEGKERQNQRNIEELREKIRVELWKGGGSGEENMQDGFDEAIEILDSLDEPSHRQLVIIVGDVGANAPRQLTNSVSEWLDEGKKDRRLVAFYVESERNPKASFTATFDSLLNKFGGTGEVRTQDSTGTMLGDVLDAVIENQPELASEPQP